MIYIKSIILLFTLLTISLDNFGQAKRALRNVVLIVTDDQSQDAGFYGNDVIQTPNLDSFASQSTVFSNAYATTASCSASRSVILSGLHNHRTAQYGHTHNYHHFRSYEDLETLPVLMARTGYRTASIGKYHVAPEEVYHFQEYLPGSSRNPVQMANNCEEFIQSEDNRPFFLYFCTSDPHRGGGFAKNLPHQPDRFGNKPLGYRGIKTVKYDPEKVIVPEFLPDNPVTRAEIAQYYQSISRIDQGMGRLLEILQAADKMKNTLIIYIADHGMAFPGAKTNVYEPALKAPCIVYHPFEDQNGSFNESFVSWTDITPSILDFSQAETPKYKMHGQSFIPIVENSKKARPREAIYASHTFHEIQMYYPMRAINDGKYKLIWNIAYPLPYPFASDLWSAPTWQHIYAKGNEAQYGVRTVKEYIHRPEFELYDVQKDPYESNNLSTNTEYAEVLKQYQEKIKQFQKKTEDPWILKWEYE